MGQLTVNYKVISIFKKDFWKVFLKGNYDSITDTTTPKKTPIISDEKTVSVSPSEVKEVVLTPEAAKLPNQKKKKTLKQRRKTLSPKKSHDTVGLEQQPLDPSADKLLNPVTKRYVKNTKSNRNKIEKLTLKRGGRTIRRTRKSNITNKYKNKLF